MRVWITKKRLHKKYQREEEQEETQKSDRMTEKNMTNQKEDKVNQETVCSSNLDSSPRGGEAKVSSSR
jgi:hypothetical protein